MSDLVVYSGLFTSAFLSATLLPGSSEAALLALVVSGYRNVVLLIIVATTGNVFGSILNWYLGRFAAHLRFHRWSPINDSAFERGTAWFTRYGKWTLLLSWLPVVGDPLTVVAGAMRVGILEFTLLVTAGKLARYLFIVAVGLRVNSALG